MIDYTKGLSNTKAHELMNKLLDRTHNEPQMHYLWDPHYEDFDDDVEVESYPEHQKYSYMRYPFLDGSSIIAAHDVFNKMEERWWQIGYHQTWIDYYLKVHDEPKDLTFDLPMHDIFKYPIGSDILYTQRAIRWLLTNSYVELHHVSCGEDPFPTSSRKAIEFLKSHPTRCVLIAERHTEGSVEHKMFDEWGTHPATWYMIKEQLESEGYTILNKAHEDVYKADKFSMKIKLKVKVFKLEHDNTHAYLYSHNSFSSFTYGAPYLMKEYPDEKVAVVTENVSDQIINVDESSPFYGKPYWDSIKELSKDPKFSSQIMFLRE